MFEYKVLFCKYARLILEEPKDLKKIKKEFQYVFILTDKKLDLPGFILTRKKTPIIDLTRPIEEILSKFDATTRNQIRKTEKIDKFEFRNLDPDWKKSYQFFRKIKHKENVPTDPAPEFKRLLFFNAYFKGELVASVSCWDNGTDLRIKTIASLRKEKDQESRLMAWATRRIFWEICKWAKNNDRKRLDLGGIDLVSQEKSGITRFKQSFGGEIIDIYIYRYETDRFRKIKKMCSIFKYSFT